MWWLVVAAGLALVGCGGKSNRVEGDSGGAGGSGATGGSSGTGAVSGGGGGDGNPVWTETADPSDPPECRDYKAQPSVTEACTALFADCPTDLQAMLDPIEGQSPAEGDFVRIGCGLTEIGNDGGLGGSTFVFDANGTLVGYRIFSDISWGPCPSAQYQRGEHLGDCPDLRECTLSLEATATGELCRCPCPDPPPEDGIATVEAACVKRSGIGCAETLDRWGNFAELTIDGTLRTGCATTAVTIRDDRDELECLYDVTGHLVGETRRSKISTGCYGVTGWHDGVTYESCPEETYCWFGPDDFGTPRRCPG